MMFKKVCLLLLSVFSFLFLLSDGKLRAYSYVKRYRVSDSFNCPGVTCLGQDSCGFVWIGSNLGITRFDGCHFRTFPIPYKEAGAFNCQPKVLAVDKNNTIWIGTMVGLFAFDIETETFLYINELLPKLITKICGIWVDDINTGRILITDGKNVFALTRNPLNVSQMNEDAASNHLCHYYNGNSMPNVEGIDWGKYGNSITAVMKDREGGVWTGTFYDGFYYYSSKQQYFMQTETLGLSPSIVRSVCITDGGTIYVGSEDKGIFIYNLEDQNLYPVENLKWNGTYIAKEVHSLVADGDTLWIGTSTAGVYLMSLRKKEIIAHLSEDSRLGCSHVVQMFRTSDGDMLIGTLNGLYAYDSQNRQCVLVKGTQGRFIHSMAQLDDTKVWVGSLGSSFCYVCKNESTGKWSAKDFSGFTYPCVTTMLVTEDNSLLIGTDNQGVWLLTSESCRNIITGEQLGSSVNYMLEDNHNRLWITSFNGLFCYTKLGEQLAHFTMKDGLKTNFFNYSSGTIIGDSLALIGTYDGMVRFRPDDFVAINNPLIPYFTNINIGGKDTVATDKLELDYNSPSFYIDYSVPTYAYQNTIYYRYKLENIDKDWIVVNDNLQRIFFSHLSVGNYRLLLQASFNPDHWFGKTIAMNIIVRPPFWKSKWAYVIYMLLAILVFTILFIMWRQYIERRDLKQQITKLLQNQKYLRVTNATSPYAMVKEIMPQKIENNLLERVDAYLELNICNRNMSVEMLAEYMNMSMSTFYRKLKASSSLSPNDYIKLYRLNMAARMLKEENSQIKMVAEKTGFSSVAYFTSCFVKHFGITPKEFKKMKKNNG